MIFLAARWPANEVTLDPYLHGKNADRTILKQNGVK